MLDILHNSDKSLSEMFMEYPKTASTIEVIFKVPEEEKFAIVDKVARVFEKIEEFETNETDGIRATNSDGFIMLRASNTQNALTMRCESTTQNGLDDLISLLVKELNKVGVDIEIKTFK
jgi:phosphomannomutase